MQRPVEGLAKAFKWPLEGFEMAIYKALNKPLIGILKALKRRSEGLAKSVKWLLAKLFGSFSKALTFKRP